VAGRCVIKAVIPAFVPESPLKKSSGLARAGGFFYGRMATKATEKALGLVPRAFSIISAGGD